MYNFGSAGKKHTKQTTQPARVPPPCTVQRYFLGWRGSGQRIFFSYDIFVHGSKFQFIDGINLNLTHVCVCCEIIFVFTYIALVVFVYKVNPKK